MACGDKYIHVVAAAVYSAGGQILLALRPDHVHQGGLWEFPGGKCEPCETVDTALNRELREELGIEVVEARPLIKVRHAYADRHVLLDVWKVERFKGVPRGVEGQRLEWVSPEELPQWPMPAADVPIVNAVRLPDHYLITGEPAHEPERFLHQLRRSLERGVRLVQLRAPMLGVDAYRGLATRSLQLCREYNARILLNAEPAMVGELGADGVHMSSARLLECSERPLGRDRWVGASCHDEHELEHAQRLGVDFAVLSPVLPTASHPGVQVLGWDRFADMARAASIPVFALGGMTNADMAEAFGRGAQGIAAIRGLWGSPT